MWLQHGVSVTLSLGMWEVVESSVGPVRDYSEYHYAQVRKRHRDGASTLALKIMSIVILSPTQKMAVTPQNGN